MITVSFRNKVILYKEIPYLYDPLTKGKGLAFAVYLKYSELFFLTFLPMSGKIVIAYSMATNDPVPLAMWTSEMQKEAEIAKLETNSTWKLFIFWYIFLIVIVGFLIYNGFQMYAKN